MDEPFSIILTQEELDYLTYEYQMVELTIEKIMKQAEAQGYVPPDKRTEKT